MKPIKQHIFERLIISKTKETNTIKPTWDKFVDMLHNTGRGIEFKKVFGRDFTINAPSRLNGTVIGSLNSSVIYNLYTIALMSRPTVIIDIDNKKQGSLSIRDREDLEDIFGEEQLSEIYNYLFYEANK